MMAISTATHPDLLAASRTLFAAHAADPNFTGCGIGYRRRGGKLTDEGVVIAMVVNKLPAAAVSRRRLLPATVASGGVAWGVDVVEAGPVRPGGAGRSSAGRARPSADKAASAEGAAPDALSHGGVISGWMNPPLQGCSISNANADESDFGTFGCYVKDASGVGTYMLSTNYVMAMVDAGTGGGGMGADSIIQPAAVDGGSDSSDIVAILEAFAPLENYATVDAAMAIYVGQTSTSDPAGPSNDVADDLMDPISQTHPAVGMIVAVDEESNTFLCTIDNVLSALGGTIQYPPVTLYASSETSSCTASPVVGTNIEKVARTSGYSSSTIDAVGVSVKIAYYPDSDDQVEYTLMDMIWTQFFCSDGDSGAIACVGGDGETYVIPPQAPCAMLSAIEDYYALPSADDTSNNSLTNQLQDQFLTLSQCGSLIIGLVYLNAQVAIDRLQADTGSAYNQSSVSTTVQGYYEEYRPQLVSILSTPDTDTVITDQNIIDLEDLVAAIGGPVANGDGGLLTADESLAYVNLMLSGVMDIVGLNYQGLIDHMNDPSVYSTAFGYLAQVPTIEMP
jgi:hypothetical protein